MAGVKGKSGRPKGVPSPNPAGRPKGAKNIVNAALKESLDKIIMDNMDVFAASILSLSLDNEKFSRVMIELIKLRLPRPVDTEESEKDRSALVTAFRSRLFGGNDSD